METVASIRLWRRINCTGFFGGVQAPVGTHQALALLAVLHPRVPAAVGQQAVLVEALAAQTRVALGAAEQIGVGVVAVAHHSAAHDQASLSNNQRGR